MHRQSVADIVKVLGGVVSRRAVGLGAPGVVAGLILARAIGTAAAERSVPTRRKPEGETPGEACYRLCTTDPAYPRTQERERQCWTGCDAWAGDEPI